MLAALEEHPGLTMHQIGQHVLVPDPASGTRPASLSEVWPLLSEHWKAGLIRSVGDERGEKFYLTDKYYLTGKGS